jgi:hypothetical protein
VAASPTERELPRIVDVTLRSSENLHKLGSRSLIVGSLFPIQLETEEGTRCHGDTEP